MHTLLHNRLLKKLFLCMDELGLSEECSDSSFKGVVARGTSRLDAEREEARLRGGRERLAGEERPLRLLGCDREYCLRRKKCKAEAEGL